MKAQQKAWYDKNQQKSVERAAEWRKSNPEGTFNAHLKRKYGIAREQYDAMVEDQGGLCAICRKPPVGHVRNGEQATRFDVDHDHVTGKVRGLLCHPCNIMLGQARDSVEILQAAILYLSRSRQERVDAAE